MKNCPVTIKIIVLVMLIQTGCIGLHQSNSPVNRNNKCQVPLSHECSNATNLWQNTIDSILQANYPSEIGFYRSIIWEDDFNNAWVMKGHEINITKQFVLKLDRPQRLCVAAHELAHLKLGHYYSKIGIFMATNFLPKSGQTIRAEKRGLDEEEEANELALVFVNNLQLGSSMAQLCQSAFINFQT